VWAIRFEFIADLEVIGLGSSAVVGLYSDSQSQTNSSLTIPSPTGSIHQASLSQLGVYSGSNNEANSNPPNPLPTESIHQALSHENSIIAGACATSQVHQSDELAVTQEGTAGSKGQGAKKNTDCWYRPPDIVEWVLQTLEFIGLDPCADNHKHVPAKIHYTKADGGLTCEWIGKVFMNSPYSCSGKWIAKLQAEFDSGFRRRDASSSPRCYRYQAAITFVEHPSYLLLEGTN